MYRLLLSIIAVGVLTGCVIRDYASGVRVKQPVHTPVNLACTEAALRRHPALERVVRDSTRIAGQFFIELRPRGDEAYPRGSRGVVRSQDLDRDSTLIVADVGGLGAVTQDLAPWVEQRLRSVVDSITGSCSGGPLAPVQCSYYFGGRDHPCPSARPSRRTSR